jgi:hypothetical protein
MPYQSLAYMLKTRHEDLLSTVLQHTAARASVEIF